MTAIAPGIAHHIVGDSYAVVVDKLILPTGACVLVQLYIGGRDYCAGCYSICTLTENIACSVVLVCIGLSKNIVVFSCESVESVVDVFDYGYVLRLGCGCVDRITAFITAALGAYFLLAVSVDSGDIAVSVVLVLKLIADVTVYLVGYGIYDIGKSEV